MKATSQMTKKEKVTVINNAVYKKIKRKIHRIIKGSTVYAEVRKNLYDAVEQRMEFKEVRWDSKGRCHIAENYPGDYRGMIATIQPKAEGKSGSVVFFTLMMYSSIRDSSKPFIKNLKPRLTVNKSNSGIQLLWFKDNKPVWKIKSNQDARSYFAKDFAHCGEILESVFKELEKIYSPEDFIPILAKMEKPLLKEGSSHKDIHPYGLNQKLMNRFSGTTNPRDLLNKVYGKEGQKSLSKNAFGGIGKIKSFTSLVVASDIVRMTKSFPTSFFDNIQLPYYGSKACVYTGMMNDEMRNVQYFLKYFNHSKIQKELLKSINDCNSETFVSTFFSGDTWHLCRDGGRMLEDICKHATAIKSRTLWNNIKVFKSGIKGTHDMITLEHAKIKYPEKKLSYRKEQKLFLHKQKVTDNIISVLPEKNHDLVVWGSTQHNCIGSYGEIVTGKGDYPNIIVGFMNTITNDWVGHAQVTERIEDGTWVIRQLKGKNNCELYTEDDNTIRIFLAKAFVSMGELLSVYDDV